MYGARGLFRGTGSAGPSVGELITNAGKPSGGLLGDIFTPRMAPGLLGYDPKEMRRQALIQGLSNAGAALLAQGPSPYPISPWQSLGQGMQGFNQGMDEGREKYRRGLIENFEMSEAARKVKERQEQKDYLDKWLPTLPADQQGLARAYPELVAKQKAESMFSAPEAPKTREFRRGSEQVTQQWNPSTRQWEEVASGQAFSSTPQVMMTGEKEYEKERGKGFASTANELDKQEQSAMKSLNSLQAMENQIESKNFYSGFGATQLTSLRRAAVAMGADPSLVTSIESFNALSKNAALDNMGGSLGTGFSNADRDFVIEQVPTLGNTPEGNKALIQINMAIQGRKIEIARLARAYEKQHGQLDTGFMDELSRWAEENPLFADAPASEPSGADGSGWTTLPDGNRIRLKGR